MSSHLDRSVPHEFLYCAQIHSRDNEPTRKGVAQAMPREANKTRRLNRRLKPLPRRNQARAITVEEHVTLTLRVSPSLRQRRKGFVIQRNMPQVTILAHRYS